MLGSVTLIQGVGPALNLNIQIHMLFLDGVYAVDKHGVVRFHRVYSCFDNQADIFSII